MSDENETNTAPVPDEEPSAEAEDETETEPEPAKREWKHTVHANDGKPKYGDESNASERDVKGYAATPVKPAWPRSAKLALNFVINYEEGGEMSLLHGDDASESLLSDLGPNSSSYPNQRNLNMESTYDYGSRCGFWRLHRLFTSRKVPVTVFGVGMALERNMEVVGAIKQQENWEVSSHGYRWWDYKDVPEEVEEEHIARAVQIHKDLFGKHPPGLYQGKPSNNTRKLAIEEGGFLYDSDAYNDDLPYWNLEHGVEHPHLVIPYSLVENDMLYTAPNGWSTPDDFLSHLKRTLDFLVQEGRAGQPKMMSVGLHCRLSRPARVAVIAEFLDYAKSYGREVWITTRESIANHWHENHRPRGSGEEILSTSKGIGGVESLFRGWTKAGAANDKSDDEDDSNGNDDGKPPKKKTPTSKFAFLGNIKAPRNSETYKESLKPPKKVDSDDDLKSKEEEVDII
mmetsp:Transcript_23523/g.55736  ORF Transcript_23523/g.55736 Transcript_23523/m.55736 type:complete len:457 (+) Transcript_23523:190-1560(+)